MLNKPGWVVGPWLACGNITARAAYLLQKVLA